MKASLALPVLAFVLSACAYENEPPRRRHPEPYEPAPSVEADDDTPAPATPPSASVSPMLAEIDTNQTMAAEPGEGVGVFVEYSAGGHWHVWWTCDTTHTKQSCDFAVSVTAATGNISNLDAEALIGGFVSKPTPSRVDATSTTSNEVHGIRFDTSAGAVLTVDASIGGVRDGAFLFFVQDGKVNGGFAGKLTNPMQLRGKTP